MDGTGGEAAVERIWIGLGSLVGLTSVAMAALAAHGLAMIGAARLHMVQSALQMQGWHALALIGCGLWAGRGGGRLVHAAGAAFLAGIVIFCGAVYGLAILNLPIGFAAPAGGSLLMLGWALLAGSAIAGGRRGQAARP